MNSISMPHSIKSTVLVGTTVMGLLLAGGCRHMPGELVATKADFRNSTRVMVRSQLADAEAAKNAGDAVVTGLDGQKSGGVLRTYRGDNATREFGDAGVNTNSVIAGGN